MKIFDDIARLNEKLQKLKNKKIVFTNGVFDLIHAGHIDLLEFAKNNGDYLVVGINDDQSVRKFKGGDRPIFPLEERMEILEAIQYVDFIIPFSEDTPISLIKNLWRVDVLVKGGDYSPSEVVGKNEVEKTGGKLLIFHFQTNNSSSSILSKILEE